MDYKTLLVQIRVRGTNEPCGFRVVPLLVRCNTARIKGPNREIIKQSTNTRKQGDRLNYKRSGYNIVFDVRSHGFS